MVLQLGQRRRARGVHVEADLRGRRQQARAQCRLRGHRRGGRRRGHRGRLTGACVRRRQRRDRRPSSCRLRAAPAPPGSRPGDPASAFGSAGGVGIAGRRGIGGGRRSPVQRGRRRRAGSAGGGAVGRRRRRSTGGGSVAGGGSVDRRRIGDRRRVDRRGVGRRRRIGRLGRGRSRIRIRRRRDGRIGARRRRGIAGVGGGPACKGSCGERTRSEARPPRAQRHPPSASRWCALAGLRFRCAQPSLSSCVL